MECKRTELILYSTTVYLVFSKEYNFEKNETFLTEQNESHSHNLNFFMYGG